MGVSISKRWYRSRRNQILLIMIFTFFILYYVSLNDREPDLDITRSLDLPGSSLKSVTVPKVINVKEPTKFDRNTLVEYIERKLELTLKQDKGSGCVIPRLDPFAKEVTQFDKAMPKVVCDGVDWVKCYHSECRVVPEILKSTKKITCTYYDIIYQTDHKYILGPPFEVHGEDVYVLAKSDHVKVKCVGKHRDSYLVSKWIGHAIGFRATTKPNIPPVEVENAPNVLIFGFDSTAKNGFIRRMPKSYKILTEKLGATVLDGYNIVGDGTPAALFPILTGKTELELPDTRKKMNNATLDSMPFIFKKLKDYGFRTAYFEDMPWIGTFQYRFNGFLQQPADHYLRSFFLEESSTGKKWANKKLKYCVGDTPQYKLMLNITDQFFRLDGKKFGFTFIADITHDDFNMISTADDDTAEFLGNFLNSGRGRDTLLFVMGDHGPRYANVRDTLQGKLEERLPLMAIRLPDYLKNSRPNAQKHLVKNTQVLTTPHDIHATILDVLNLNQYQNPYKVKGADLHRGLSLLETIPENRSCSEAGIEPHWCSCLSWQNVSTSDIMYEKTARALVDYINSLTEEKRSKCAIRNLKSISWVMKKIANNGVLTFVAAKDVDGYVGKFGAKMKIERDDYQVKLAVGPGHGVYEASMTYVINEGKFEINSRDISRTNAYNNEPSCVSATHPHLNMYCYCNG